MPKYRNSLNRDDEDQDPLMSRRSFLALMGVGACLIGTGTLFGASLLGFLYPNAMKTPPSVFSIGRPEEVLGKDGKVFYPKQKVFIETRSGKVRVQTAVCTHLGCTVNMVQTGYSCPCHGSTYDSHGVNTGGPAPLPLVYFGVSKGAAGDLIVDKQKTTLDWDKAWFPPIA
ncbi:MAG TPA: Rieske 2Fe-2S domain-containing protein [Parachlamydiaceae bacterium]|nr:Rieske 2Fe-2S domain-containing protein [Parachlamydiaceae bacterium]